MTLAVAAEMSPLHRMVIPFDLERAFASGIGAGGVEWVEHPKEIPQTSCVGKLRMANRGMDSLKTQIETARKSLRKQGKKYEGLRFIDRGSNPEHFVFGRGDRNTKTAVENLDKQDAGNFKVFVNWNGEIVVQQTAWNPHFYLV